MASRLGLGLANLLVGVGVAMHLVCGKPISLHAQQPPAEQQGGVKLLPVSKRLLRELVYPQSPQLNGFVTELSFSPDSKRLIGDGLDEVVIWDVATGKRQHTFEVDPDLRKRVGTFQLSPDWKLLYLHRESLEQTETVQRGNKQLKRYEFTAGGVEVYDTETGKLARTWQHDPARNVRFIWLSSNGSKLVSYGNLSGEYESDPDALYTIWDVNKGTVTELSADASYSSLSRDGHYIAATRLDGKRNEHELAVLDLRTLKDRWRVAADAKERVAPLRFSQNGRWLFATTEQSTPKGDSYSFAMSLRVYDAQAGKVHAEFAAPRDQRFIWQLSPDDKTVIGGLRGHGDDLIVRSFDVEAGKLIREITLAKRDQEHKPTIGAAPAFSADGKRVAIVCLYRSLAQPPNSDHFTLPQPRLFILDSATLAVQQELVLPQAGGYESVFSPDGRMVATGGWGKVYLWNVAD